MALRFDASRLAKSRRSPQGFVRVDARLTRTGVFKYVRADGSVVHELRHPKDVFDPASLASADAGLPVTIGHQGTITPENVGAHKVGQTRKDASASDRFVVSELQIEGATAIARVDAGELVELSAGYSVDIMPESGTYEGQRYDQRQTNIRYNHVALLPQGGGRAGTEVGLRLDSGDAVLADTASTEYDTGIPMRKIRIDGVEYEVPEHVAVAYEKVQGELAASAAALKTAGDNLTAATARADAAEAPAAVDARVAARTELVTSAQKILGKEFDAAGKSDRQVREAALSKAGVRFDDKSSPAYLEGAFAALIAAPKQSEAQSLVVPPAPSVRSDAKDAPKSAAQIREEEIAKKGEMWKAAK